MTETVERLIYRIKIAPGPRGTEELERLFDISGRWNRANQIVGALALSGQIFVQALQGRQHRIDALLARLGGELQNADLQILARWPIVGPGRDDWSTARSDLARLATRALDTLVAATPLADPAGTSRWLGTDPTMFPVRGS